jgi:hypothetical protein
VSSWLAPSVVEVTLMISPSWMIVPEKLMLIEMASLSFPAKGAVMESEYVTMSPPIFLLKL